MWVSWLVLQMCVIHSWCILQISHLVNPQPSTLFSDHICFSWPVFSFLVSSLQASILLLTSFVLLFLPFAFLLYNSLFSFTYLCLCGASKIVVYPFFFFSPLLWGSWPHGLTFIILSLSFLSHLVEFSLHSLPLCSVWGHERRWFSWSLCSAECLPASGPDIWLLHGTCSIHYAGRRRGDEQNICKWKRSVVSSTLF